MTSAAGLLNTPNSDRQWDEWAFLLSQNLSDIRQALLKQKNISLPDYVLYPVPWSSVYEWLERVSTVVDQICANTGAQARDIERVDLDDQRAKQAWVWEIFNEVQQARQNLSI